MPPPTSGRRVYVYDVDIGSETRHVVSILDPELAFVGGLRPEGILGTLTPGDDPTISPDRFVSNPAFVSYLSELIAGRVFDIDDLRREAQRQGDGFVYLLDGRTPTPLGSVPPADVLGAIAVQGGELVPGSYQHNPNHRLLTTDGFFVLPAELEAALAADLRARCSGSPTT